MGAAGEKGKKFGLCLTLENHKNYKEIQF